MKAPHAVIEVLMAKARRVLYFSLPERSWFTQQVRVKLALTLPAKWLDDRKVEITAERYQAIVEGILDTIAANGCRDPGAFPCAYLWHCVEQHMAHHGDEYYFEGKGVRNLLKMSMSAVEKAKAGADGTVPVIAQVHAALDAGKRKPKIKAPAVGLQPDLFAPANRLKVLIPLRNSPNDPVDC